MGMGFRQAIRADVPMHIEVGDHALVDEFGLHEVAGEFDALALTHLTRQGELHLAGELRVLPDLDTPRHRSTAARGRATPPVHCPAA